MSWGGGQVGIRSGRGLPGSFERSSRGEAVLVQEDAVLAEVLKIRFYPFVAAAAEGVRMWDLEGNTYLDLTGSAGVAQTGYGRPRVTDAIVSALRRNPTDMLCCHATEAAARGSRGTRPRQP